MKPKTAQPVKKTISHAPGFQCPACAKATIQLSLDQFLDTSRISCHVCGMVFTMNKSDCSQLVDMLQRLRVSQRNVELVSNRKL